MYAGVSTSWDAASAPRVPRHIALIMDGNGRWARERGLSRTQGHRAGVEALRTAVRTAGELGIEYLTVYSFSSENWSRPEGEISELMELLRRFIRKDLAELHRNNVRVRIIGRRDDLEPAILDLLLEAEGLTRDNDGQTLVVAFNYGARQEIAAAASRLAKEVAAGRLDPADIDADRVAGMLDTAGIPEPDLLIRTSGEQRLSNFLLWQCAYTEFVFSPLYWPDFDRDALVSAIDEFNARERRFGGLKARTGS